MFTLTLQEIAIIIDSLQRKHRMGCGKEREIARLQAKLSLLAEAKVKSLTEAIEQAGAELAHD